jgi:hypothetical protein
VGMLINGENQLSGHFSQPVWSVYLEVIFLYNFCLKIIHFNKYLKMYTHDKCCKKFT